MVWANIGANTTPLTEAYLIPVPDCGIASFIKTLPLQLFKINPEYNMRNTLTKKYHILFTNRDGFILLIRKANDDQYKLPLIQCIPNELFEVQVGEAVALMTSAYITSIDSPHDVGINKKVSYLRVNFRGPFSLKQHEGIWADPTDLIYKEIQPGIEEALKKWNLKKSPAEKILHAYRQNRSQSFLRGMKAGIDYSRVFINPEILPDDKEQYMRGWKTARRRLII